MKHTDTVESVLRESKTYKLACAFNGGKESVVVFHLIQTFLKDVDVVYFNVSSDDDFPEIIEFLSFFQQKYGISICNYTDIKHAISDIKKVYGVNAILMGNRKTDPNCSNLSHFSNTTDNYPSILRINPILDWTYKNVWDYLSSNNYNTCSLYEKGYTSIGLKSNTFPNYNLFDGQNFVHAKYLQNDSEERVGRTPFNLPLKHEGTIIHGKKMGRTLNCPTANIKVDNCNDNCNDNYNDEAISKLKEGVYYGSCVLRDTHYKMIMSYGRNVSFRETFYSLEIHILHDFEGNEFYGETLQLSIEKWMRPMFNLPLSQLTDTIMKDINIGNFFKSQS